MSKGNYVGVTSYEGRRRKGGGLFYHPFSLPPAPPPPVVLLVPTSSSSHLHFSHFNMKRVFEEGEDKEELSKVSKPKTSAADDDASSFPAGGSVLERSWWFVTCGEDGASYYIIEWRPSTAQNPIAVAAALLEAREHCVRLNTAKAPSLYFYNVVKWIMGRSEEDEERKTPEEFSTFKRAELGTFTALCEGGDPGELMHDGRVLFYSSWF